MSEASDISLLSLDNHNFISQGKICSSHGGLAIYLLNKYDHKTFTIQDHPDIWEGQFIEISGVTLQKNIVIGNIYRPPKDLINNYRNFKEQLIPVIEHLHSINLEAAIAGDMNIDLLKINERNIFTEYFDSMVSHGFSPCITLPPRFSKRSATLIDNFVLKFLVLFQTICYISCVPAQKIQ